MAGGGQDCGIGRAHDVLAEGVEAVEVVLHGAVEGLVVQEVEVVAADGFLFFSTRSVSVRLLGCGVKLRLNGRFGRRLDEEGGREMEKGDAQDNG